MGNLGDILNKKIKSLGIERQVEAVGVVEKAIIEIGKILPGGSFEVISYNRGNLKVKTSGVAATEIRMKINQKFLTENKIKRIIFVS